MKKANWLIDLATTSQASASQTDYPTSLPSPAMLSSLPQLSVEQLKEIKEIRATELAILKSG